MVTHMTQSLRALLLALLLIAPYVRATKALFEMHPALETIPHIDFCVPTPLLSNEQLSHKLGVTMLIKDDGLTMGNGEIGGNKARKLEFLLADACAKGAQKVVTQGCVGSNHATATASCCRKLGLDCALLLSPEPNSTVVRRNLILDHTFGATMQYCANGAERTKASSAFEQEGDSTYVIPTGGSNALGVFGYVNAMCELKQQLDAQGLPYPIRIYVALGTAGTLTGLVLGAKLTGMPCMIVGTNTNAGNYFCKQVPPLFVAANRLLHNADPSIPLYALSSEDYEILEGHCGQGYGYFTPQGQAAKALVQEATGITLDGVYTAKAFAGMLADIEQKQLQGSTVLFWNTFCSTPYDDVLAAHDYRNLPEPFHKYFEGPVQELDR